MTTNNPYPYVTQDFVEKFGLHRNTVRKRARALGIGIDREGRAGYAYSEADFRKFEESMRPVVIPAPRQRKRSA